MDFFVSWSRSDAVYCNYFDNCNVLISPHNTDRSFNLGKWPKQPQKVIVDSCAYYYLSSGHKMPSQKRIFREQLRIIKGANCPVIICQLDQPIGFERSNTIGVYNAIEKTLGNAYEFLELFHRYEFDKNPEYQPMGTIQGNNKLSIQFCASELKRLGFKLFGLGSLAPLFHPQEIINRIQWASEIVGGENLHIFGISRLDILEELSSLNIMSLDSTRPVKAAIFNGVFYSKPFRIYGIQGSRNDSHFARLLTRPLKCNCPSCKVDPNLLLETGSKKATNARAIHNYYHLIKHLKADKNST